MSRLVLLSDCQSFYASVEKAAHPEYAEYPVIVAGDPERRAGIVLAACPMAKSWGITTAETVGTAVAKCPDVVVLKPRMQTYINCSLLITEIYEKFSDLVEPFSCDEQFIDITDSTGIFGTAVEIAKQIQERVLVSTGVFARVGISETKILAKMATDIYAKKSDEGIFVLPRSEIADLLWHQPVNKMYGVASRMTAHFARMGIYTIGDIAKLSLPEFKKKMKVRLGKNSDIQAEVYWRTAHGLDDSPVSPGTFDQSQQAIGHGMTLPRDYTKREEIDVVLLELAEEVCRRCRSKGFAGRVIHTGAMGADYDMPTGFHRQATLPDPTNMTREVYEGVRRIFYKHWNGHPVRKLSVTLSDLTPDNVYQLTFFGNREKTRKLEHATDEIKNRFGTTSILRASSYQASGQAIERSHKIGGHYK
ncbi:DNA polymerase IV [Paenibacillus lutrae]|uniref:DNA polymerase IV n=1 Tax=Paenibacillus lutrae TaxID=2078573 RepID=A0A7X3FGG1_9BACL|nr:DNA polymerase IV [Paenibacillus lutrae]MVO99216.1 DNA polymerase IV [Paenibacillus lutrae]